MNPAASTIGSRSRWFLRLVRWALGTIFLVAGGLKVLHPAAFYADLPAYQLGAPDAFLRTVAVVLPWLELISGGLLLANCWVGTASVLVVAQSLVFVLVLGQAVLRGLDLHCGCFGTVSWGWLDSPLAALARTSLLFLASVRLAWTHRHYERRADGVGPAAGLDRQLAAQQKAKRLG